MEKEISVTLTTREALAIITALMDLGLNRQHGRPHLAGAEMKLATAISEASRPILNDDCATRSQSSYEADSCL